MSDTIAIAHDYLTQRGGAERVVLSMCEALDVRQVHTLLYEPSQTYPEFANIDVLTSPLNRLSSLRANHRRGLPLYAFASGRLRVDADVVLASSSGWAHGFPTDGRKIVYCYSPARWLYQGRDFLGDSAGRTERLGLEAAGPLLRRWDARAAGSADAYLAISKVVQDRIWRTYGIESQVLGAPHSMDASADREAVELPARLSENGFLLCVSRLLPYKNVDKVLAGAAKAGMGLVVVGSGPARESLMRHHAGEGTAFLSGLTDAQMRYLYAECTAVVSASIEDYGLTPLEANAFGKPSITPRDGGFLDTVVEGLTGVHFAHREPALIADAIAVCRKARWDSEGIRRHAEKYSEASFAARLRDVVL